VWRVKELEIDLSLFQTAIPDALWDDLADAELVRKI
jgi:hypothetical protein